MDGNRYSSVVALCLRVSMGVFILSSGVVLILILVVAVAVVCV